MEVIKICNAKIQHVFPIYIDKNNIFFIKTEMNENVELYFSLYNYNVTKKQMLITNKLKGNYLFNVDKYLFFCFQESQNFIIKKLNIITGVIKDVYRTLTFGLGIQYLNTAFNEWNFFSVINKDSSEYIVINEQQKIYKKIKFNANQQNLIDVESIFSYDHQKKYFIKTGSILFSEKKNYYDLSIKPSNPLTEKLGYFLIDSISNEIQVNIIEEIDNDFGAIIIKDDQRKHFYWAKVNFKQNKTEIFYLNEHNRKEYIISSNESYDHIFIYENQYFGINIKKGKYIELFDFTTNKLIMKFSGNYSFFEIQGDFIFLYKTTQEYFNTLEVYSLIEKKSVCFYKNIDFFNSNEGELYLLEYEK